MSGHSKWATTRRAKEATDKKRSAIFGKLARAITVAAREGGADEATNFKLRLAISKAKQANMPKDNIKRAIESGIGTGADGDYKEDIYEAYGPGGSAIIIETLSNNVNRTISEIKFTLTKYGGKLAERNSALRLFEKVGLITIPKEFVTSKGQDALELMLIDAGADDIETHDGGTTGIFSLETFNTAVDRLAADGVQQETETVTRPFAYITLDEKEKAALEKLIDMLEELDDVEAVFTNVETA